MKGNAPKYWQTASILTNKFDLMKTNDDFYASLTAVLFFSLFAIVVLSVAL